MSVSSSLRYRSSLSRSFTGTGMSAGVGTRAPQLPPPPERLPMSSAVRAPENAPEMMLLSSLSLCLLSSFERLAARDRIALRTWDAEIIGEVERTPEGWMFTSIVLQLDLELEGAISDDLALKVDDLLERAKHACLVLNSLRAPVVVEAQLRSADVDVDDDDDASIQPPRLPPLRPRAVRTAITALCA